MTASFRSVPLTPDVHWVGAVDWTIRDFHGYATSRGTTYNAYLVLAEKITLLDTVKSPFFPEMMARIASVTDPANIDYVVSNHAEMDHSGSLPQALEALRPAKVFASPMGRKALEAHFGLADRVTEVKDGSELSLGDRTLRFFETRMLHWPDSMITYLPEEKILFSQDGFGMHLASTERFADQLPADVLAWEAAKYYANILLPFSPLVKKLLGRVAELGLDIALLAPDHGPVWRSDVGRPLAWYDRWAEQQPTAKAVVAYDTMWGSTEQMARAVAEGLSAGGATPRLRPLGASHRSDVATDLLDAGALLAGSPTMNNNLFPTLADLLTYLRGLRPRKLVGAAFGSYGWSGEAPRRLAELLEEMKVEVVQEPLRHLYVPDPEALARCFDLGRAVAGRLAEAADGDSHESS